MKLSLIMMIALGSLGAFADVDSAFVGASVYQQRKLIFKKQVRISNNLNTYRIDFLQFQPTLTRGPSFQVRLREPTVWYSFSRPIRSFINIKINEISIGSLEPHEKQFKLWKKNEQAGVDALLNFDGVALVLSFFMKDDSPVLWATLSPTPSSAGKIDSASMRLYTVPSIVVSGKLSGIYKRVAYGTVERFTQKKTIQEIPVTNNYLVLADEKFQPLRDGKATGPCFVAFDTQNTKQILLNMRNYYRVDLWFNLKPSFKSFSLGFWESEKKYNNQEFLTMLKRNINVFTLK